MYIKQVSIFVDNKKGSISDVISILGQANINIKALSVADAADFGILRLIVDGPEKAYEIVKQNGYNVKIASTIAIAVEDKANELGRILEIIKNNDLDVTYIYSLVGYMNNNSVVILKTQALDKTLELLKENNVKIVKPEELYED